MYGVELTLRALFLNMTLLPDPNPECAHYTPHVQLYSPLDLACGDMMFSGRILIILKYIGNAHSCRYDFLGTRRLRCYVLLSCRPYLAATTLNIAAAEWTR